MTNPKQIQSFRLPHVHIQQHFHYNVLISHCKTTMALLTRNFSPVKKATPWKNHKESTEMILIQLSA